MAWQDVRSQEHAGDVPDARGSWLWSARPVAAITNGGESRHAGAAAGRKLAASKAARGRTDIVSNEPAPRKSSTRKTNTGDAVG